MNTTANTTANTPDNITFFFEEKIDDTHLENNYEIQNMLKEFEDEFNKEAFNPVKEGAVNTVKDLLKICQYYGIDKDIKLDNPDDEIAAMFDLTLKKKKKKKVKVEYKGIKM
jgi:hypothetical protein